MVAHIELPALDKTSGPATFSQPVVTGLLREQLGFQGLDLYRRDEHGRGHEVGHGSGENAVKAVLAGIDVVLDSRDTMDAFRGLKAAVESRPDSAGAARGVGAPHPDGEGAARPASDARGQSRSGAARSSARGATRRSRGRSASARSR